MEIDINKLQEIDLALRTVIDQTCSCIFAKDTQGRYTYVNQKTQELFGASYDDIIGKNDSHFLDLGLANELRLNDRRVIDLGETLEREEKTFIKQTGEQRTYWAIKKPVRNAEGEIIGLCGISTDITERKSTEDALRKSEAQMKESISLLHATIESTNDAILVVDLKNKWVMHNNQFISLWHIPNEIISAKDDAAALSNVLDQLENPEVFINKVRELYATPEASSFDTLKFKDGRIIERRSIPQRIDEKVIGRVWSFRDITERKHVEDELRNTHSNLVAAQKLARIGSWEWDVRSNEAKWSDETYRIFGINKSKLSEHRENFLDLILPEDRSLVDKALSDALDEISSR